MEGTSLFGPAMRTEIHCVTCHGPGGPRYSRESNWRGPDGPRYSRESNCRVWARWTEIQHQLLRARRRYSQESTVMGQAEIEPGAKNSH